MEQITAQRSAYVDGRGCYKRRVDGTELEDPECLLGKFRVGSRQEVVGET